MAENEFEKTVKLPASGSKSNPTPENDKTVKLTATSSAPTSPPITPILEEKKVVSPVPPAPKKKLNLTQILVVTISALVILLSSVWYFLPTWLKNKSEQLANEGKHTESAQKLNYALYLCPLNKPSFLISLGRELRLSKDYILAQKNLEKVLQKDPDNFKALRELGQVFRESGQIQKAFELFKKSAQLNPSDNEILKWAAQLAFELKNYNDACSLYESVTKSEKATAEDWAQLGTSYFNLGKLEESIKALQTALDKNNQTNGVRPLLAKICLMQEQFPSAVEYSHQELLLSPDDAELKESFAEICLAAGNFSAARKKSDEAIRFYLSGLTVPSKCFSDLHYQLAIAYSKQKKKNETFNHIREAVKNDPSMKLKVKTESAFAIYRKSLEFKKIVR